MKQTSLFSVCLLLLAACTHTAKISTSKQEEGLPQTDTHGIRCVKAMNLSPEFNHLNEVIGLDTNYAYIYWRGNQRHYVMTYTFKKNDGLLQKPTEWIKEKHMRRLVFTEGSPDGAYYDERIMIYNQKVNADLILKDTWLDNSKLLLHTGSTHDTLQVSKQLPGIGDTLYESWGFGVKDQPTVYGKVQLYFVPKRNDLPYSLDTAIERTKGMTLCKLITFIHSHTPGKNNAVNITLHNELKEIAVTNAAELLPFFERQKRGEYSVQITDALKE